MQGESAVLREYHAAKREGRLPELAWAALMIAGAGSAIVAAVTLLAIQATAGSGIVPADFARLLPLLIPIAAATQVLGIQLVLLRFADRPALFGLVSLSDVAVTAGTTFVLLVRLDWGIEGALVAVLTGKLTGIALAWSATFASPPSHLPQRELFRRMLAFSIPVMAPAILNWVQTNGARVVLVVFLSFADVAIASIGIRVAAVFGFVVYAFRLAWEPWAFRQLDDADSPAAAHGNMLKLYVVAMTFAAMLAITISPVLVAIFAPPQYAQAVALCGGFIMGQLWIGIATIAAIGIHGSRRTGHLTTVFVTGAGTNLALLVLLSPLVGVVGAMVAFLASAIASGFAAAITSNRLYTTGFSMRLLVAGAIASVALGAIAHAIFAPNAGEPLIKQAVPMAQMGAAGLLVVALLVLAAISPAERQTALQHGALQWRAALGAIRSKDSGSKD